MPNDLKPNKNPRQKGLTGGRPNIVKYPENESNENREIEKIKTLDKMLNGGMLKKPKKASLGALIGIGADNLLKKSETARSLTKNLGIGGNLLGSYYDKKADTRDKTTGSEQTKQITAKRMGGMAIPDYADGGEVVFGKGKDYIKDLL